MREIRFRAFYRPRGLMLNVLSIGFINQWLEMECPYEDLEGGDNISAMFHEIELMQYAGLIDKNGRKIYEGDIVKFNSVSPSGNKYPLEDTIGSVIFETGCFMVDPLDNTARIYGLNELGEWCVIGNIYENPELLDKRSMK